jgi:hypothetical protein
MGNLPDRKVFKAGALPPEFEGVTAKAKDHFDPFDLVQNGKFLTEDFLIFPRIFPRKAAGFSAASTA